MHDRKNNNNNNMALRRVPRIIIALIQTSAAYFYYYKWANGSIAYSMIVEEYPFNVINLSAAMGINRKLMFSMWIKCI